MIILKNVFLGLISVLVTLAIIEAMARIIFFFSGIHTSTNSRVFEPYFVSGDAFENFSNNVFARGDGGPSTYGYEKKYGIYFYMSKDRSLNARSRADFLFNHELSRYSAKEVDKIAEEQPCAIRIVVIGGSAAKGIGASSKDATWHALLEKKLRSELNRLDIFIFNAAMGAFVSAQERIAYDLAIAPRKPDLVINLNGFNDVNLPLKAGVAPGDPLQMGLRYAQVYSSPWFWVLANNSTFFRYIHNKYIDKYLYKHSREIIDDEYWSMNVANNISAIYIENMRYLIYRGKQSGTPTIVVFQPWKLISKARRIGKWGIKRRDEVYLQYYIYGRIKDGLQEEEREGKFVDISNIFTEEISNYVDEVHVADKGQRIIAESVENVLLPIVTDLVISKNRVHKCAGG